MFSRFAPQKNWQEKIFERIFKDRKLRKDQLLPFGFFPEENGFSYRAKLLAGMFYVKFEIHSDASIHAELCGNEEDNDKPSSIPRTPTSFLGRQLRKEYEEELWHVAECCFESDIFKNDLTQRVIRHIQETYGSELEFLWRKSPGSAIVRRQENGKWYAVLLVVPRLKLAGSSEERVEVLNLRVYPEELEDYVDNISRFPGYHMNKKHWVSLCLDGSIPFEELAARLEISYRLARK